MPASLDSCSGVFSFVTLSAAGTVVDASLVVVDPPGAVVDASGAVDSAPGAVVDASGAVDSAPGAVVDAIKVVVDARPTVVIASSKGSISGIGARQVPFCGTAEVRNKGRWTIAY